MHSNKIFFDLDVSAIFPRENTLLPKEELTLVDDPEAEKKEINLLLSLMTEENNSTALPTKKDNYFEIEVDECEEILSILRKQPRTTKNYNIAFAKSSPQFFGIPKQIPLAGRILISEKSNESNSTATTIESSETQNASSNTLYVLRPIPRRVSNPLVSENGIRL